jgi:hypothetical protein
VAWLQPLKLRTKVELIDLAIGKSYALGEICGVPCITFHGSPISLGQCTVTLINIKKGSIKLLFPNHMASRLKYMANGVVIWFDKDIVVCK